MKIEIRDFSGIAPRYSPELLGDGFGQKAKNLSIKSGKIHPEKPFAILAPDRDYVPGQVNDDQYNRLYFLAGGTLCMYGKFSGNSYSVRAVDMSPPGTVTLTVKTSPLLESLGHTTNGQMALNYNSNSWKTTYNIADVYAMQFLTGGGNSWNELADGTLTRTYNYNNSYAVIVWPRGRMKE